MARSRKASAPIAARSTAGDRYPARHSARAFRYNLFQIIDSFMPRRLGRKLMLSITVIVIIVAAVSGLVNVKTEETQFLKTMVLGADQLSKGITSATWHAMLADNREAAYQVMQTIALKQGIDRIRMYNSAGQVMFSTRDGDRGASAPSQ